MYAAQHRCIMYYVFSLVYVRPNSICSFGHLRDILSSSPAEIDHHENPCIQAVEVGQKYLDPEWTKLFAIHRGESSQSVKCCAYPLFLVHHNKRHRRCETWQILLINISTLMSHLPGPNILAKTLFNEYLMPSKLCFRYFSPSAFLNFTKYSDNFHPIHLLCNLPSFWIVVYFQESS